ncbi:TSUP family transporter [Streptomyces dysideae]|uniref:TSUP family transporter n=1 Tax=Streptomyces dysideae TaxID=909626 RepID=UPI00099E32BD|nr:sulfite exporter TauE/SafE family protein [Streptomyces dysideae]
MPTSPAGNLGKTGHRPHAHDATGGGGWGPVGTPALLASGRMEPRKVIGSIDTSEFLVAIAASLGFLLSLGSQGIAWLWVAAFLADGLVAAPIAAWLVRILPPRVLGSVVGGVILVTNVRTLLNSDWLGVSGGLATTVYVALYALWAAALGYSIRAYRKEQTAEAEARPAVSVAL